MEGRDGKGAGSTAVNGDLFKDYALALSGKSNRKRLLRADESQEDAFGEGISRVQEHINSAASETAVCLICLETMGNSAAVWHCWQSCHCVFHLVCIQAWARQQMAAASQRAAELPAFGSVENGAKQMPNQPRWDCPKCRQEYSAGQVPAEYRCFCGKEVDPVFNPWNWPHTCGNTCERELPSGCGHRCLLLCHPGPCPPCPLQVEVDCHCGKATQKRRCGVSAEWSCGKMCGAKLPCGHKCPYPCHPGDCLACGLKGVHTCRCGRESATLPCAQSKDFRCGSICGQQLSCNKPQHHCMETCCTDAEHHCPLEGPRACPCGKVLHLDVPCTSEAPSCGQTCDKLLPCGQHRCQDLCGKPCSTNCRAMTLKSCSCGAMQKQMPCNEPLRCERRCTNVRNCGRHPCKRRCCDGRSCPPCDLHCQRRLKCGNHKCPAPCHPGPCLPCPLTSRVTCACGSTAYRLPCGSEARAGPPKCERPCVVPRTCRHKEQLPEHKCHFGPCPECPLPCNFALPCGHACGSATCHDPRPPPVAEFEQPRHPVADGFTPVRSVAAAHETRPAAHEVAKVVTAMEIAQSCCPPCSAPVLVTCVRGHASVEKLCSSAAAFSCGKMCDQPLACGHHTCRRHCHPLALSQGLREADAACEKCERECSQPRACSHPCPLPCHPGPCPDCHEKLSRSCHCSRTLLIVDCSHLTQAESIDGKDLQELLCCHKTCSKQLAGCPHTCTLICHPGACLDSRQCTAEVTLRCACRRKRAKAACNEVQAQLAAHAQGGPPESIKEGVAVRLLECDDNCQKQKAKRSKADAESAAADEASSMSATVTPVVSNNGPAPFPSSSRARRRTGSETAEPSRPLSKAERARLRQQQEDEAAAASRRRKRNAQLLIAAQVVGTLLLVLILAGGLIYLLTPKGAAAPKAPARPKNRQRGRP